MNKYKANKVEYKGIKFDSQKECERFMLLEYMDRCGTISDLRLQVKYELIPAQYDDGYIDIKGKKHKPRCIERAVNYVADFQYMRDGKLIVEDVKGYRGGESYKVFTIKRKLLLYKYGIHLIET